MSDMTLTNRTLPAWREYLALCKPRVVSLIIFTAIVGMLLSTPGAVPLDIFVFATLGIALAAGSAGAAGAAPPVLGWTAVTGTVDPHALLLFLIIFAWTPPHFWALAIYRREEYAKAAVPMLPITHGVDYTRVQILLYTIVLTIVTILPYATYMCGPVYLAAAVILDAGFLYYAIRMLFDHRDELAKRTFTYSIIYLTLLFIALFIDHYLPALQRLV